MADENTPSQTRTLLKYLGKELYKAFLNDFKKELESQYKKDVKTFRKRVVQWLQARAAQLTDTARQNIGKFASWTAHQAQAGAWTAGAFVANEWVQGTRQAYDDFNYVVGGKRKGQPISAQAQQQRDEWFEEHIRQANKKQKMNDIEMIPDNEAEMQAVMRAMGPTESNPKSSKETPITPAVPEWGFPETHTTKLKFKMYFSLCQQGYANSTCKRTSSNFRISMVNPIQPLKTTITHVNESAVTVIPTGWYDRMMVSPNQTNWVNKYGLFPEQYNPLGTAAGWAYWAKQYESWTPIGCKWSAVIDNVGYYRGHDMALCMQYNTSTTADTTNVSPAATLDEASTWKDCEWKIIEGGTVAIIDYGGSLPGLQKCDYHSPEIVSGSYRPGQANRIVQNDQDTKTWYSVSEGPTLYEDLLLRFYNTEHSIVDQQYANICLNLEYVVQFKDLKNQIRYPTNGAGPITPTIITDTQQATVLHT